MGDEHPDNPHPDADGDVTRPDGGPAPEEDVTEGGTVDPDAPGPTADVVDPDAD